MITNILSRAAKNSMRTLGITMFLAALSVFGLISVLTADSYAEYDDPLAKTYEAHGGLDKWNSMSELKYTLVGFPLSPQVQEASVSTVDLNTRNNTITSEGYTVGFNGSEAWASPSMEAVGLPPRFYALGSFYYIGIPFVFADEGTVVKDAGTEEVNGKTYKVVNVSYNDGTGYSSDDEFVVYIDSDTHKLAFVNNSVSEIEAVERVTWVYDEWQEVDGLLVPAKISFYPGWKPGQPGEGPVTHVKDLSFSDKAPNPSIYNPPSGAQIVKAPY